MRYPPQPHTFVAGKLLFILIEVLDVTVYIPAYRGAAMVAFNYLGSAFVQRAAVFPAVLGAVDCIEDFLQARENLK